MPFDLVVEFAGLCLYVEHPTKKQVAVLMPDGRFRTNSDREHLDGLDAILHVGYMRLDAANLPWGLPHNPNPKHDPRYELVHRFNRQVLAFDPEFEAGPLRAGQLQAGIVAPDFRKFTDLEPLPRLFTANPPKPLLMRTILTGGTLTSELTKEKWKMQMHFKPTGGTVEGKFASTVTWVRPVPGDSITLRVNDFAGNTEAAFTLKPVVGQKVVRVKIANLCADNPLEWTDLPPRVLEGDYDFDFKWLYRLYRPQGGKTYEEILKQSGKTWLPAPRRERFSGDTASQNCIPAKTSFAF